MFSVKKKLFPSGGSLAILIPKIWLDSKGLKAQDLVEIMLNDFLTIKPIKSGKRP